MTAAATLAKRRERVLEGMPALSDFLAGEFEEAKGKGFHLFAKRRVRAKAREAGFGLTEIMIMMQIASMLWQLWQEWKKNDAEAALVHDSGTLARLYDTAANTQPI